MLNQCKFSRRKHSHFVCGRRPRDLFWRTRASDSAVTPYREVIGNLYASEMDGLGEFDTETNEDTVGERQGR